MFALAAPLLLDRVRRAVRSRRTARAALPGIAHHIAERYGLLIIIALGEGVIGTIASLSAVVGPEGPGWSLDAGLVAVAGIALTFGMWWIYFVVPCGEILSLRRERSFGWGYGHLPIIGAVVATGGGLHVAAYFLEEKSALGASATVLCVVVPVAVYVFGIYALYTYLSRSTDAFHLTLLAGSVVLLVAPLLLASGGASMPWCLIVLALTPWVTVVGYELRGHRHNARCSPGLPGRASLRGRLRTPRARLAAADRAGRRPRSAPYLPGMAASLRPCPA